MRQAAYILMIIATVLLGIALIPLAWMIPMTLRYKKAQTDGEPHVALGVCTIALFFFTGGIFAIISGIFILVSK